MSRRFCLRKATKFGFRLGRLSHVRAYKIWLHPDVIFRWSKLKKEQDKYIKVINEVTYSIVREKQTQLSQKGGQDTHQFLDNLLRERNENGERVMTIEEIKDEVNTLMFAVSVENAGVYIFKV